MTDAQKTDPKAALFELISHDRPLAEVEQLLDGGADPNCSDKLLGTALAWAAACDREGIIEVLLARGAAIDGTGPRGETPLIVALTKKKLIAAQLLIDRGADVTCRSRWGHSALYYATQSGDQPLVEKILGRLSSGGKPDAEVLLEAAKRGDLAVTALLVDAGAAVAGTSGLGAETALHSAAYHGKLEVVRYLVDQGAPLAARDNRGNTPLAHAAWGGHLDVIKHLLAAGADVNHKNDLNWNALMQAAVQGHVAAAKLLVESGSQLNEIDREQGVTALKLAKDAKCEPLVRVLIEHGAKEREIRRPEKAAEYFPITDCDVCAYLAHKKELPRSTTPSDTPNLETLHTTETSPERYTTDTVYIKRCTVCGTHYHHEHRIDTEDAFATPPSISQNLLRYNLLGLKETLSAVGLHDELAAVTARYPDLVASFKHSVQQEAPPLSPNIRPFLVETVVDALILHDRLAELEASLLRHPNVEIALETAKNLIWIYASSPRATYPYHLSYRDVTSAIADKLKPWLQANLAMLMEALRALAETAQRSGDEALKKRVLEARSAAQYAKLF